MDARQRRCFASLRRHSFSQLCALAFVALILVPFTAPFPTVHLDTTSAGHSFDALPKDVKEQSGPDDEFIVLSMVSVAPPGVKPCAVESLGDSSQVNHAPPRDTILRV